MYSETCIDWSCSKAETLLRKADTFDLVYFLYASLSRISKVKTVKRTLLQTDNFFQSSGKKASCLTRTWKKILGISEKQRNKKKHFPKRNIFLNFKTTIFFFWFHFAILKGVWYFWVELCIFFSKFLSATNSCFASLKAISNRDIDFEYKNINIYTK